MDKEKVLQFIDDHENVFTDLSDQVWDYAEIAFREHDSMEAICSVLETYGFKVEKGLADMPTAFSATYGSGKPVIGILGEYDALSALSQKSDSLVREELVENAPGHGCGHNMLGAGSLAAAVAISQYLKENKGSGTVVYFGCPAEEGGSGKAFMARAGLFDDIDAALTWHPSSTNGVLGFSMLANYQVDYSFKGIASHAAAAPHLGRSALDAVELMNVGCNYLREHVIQEARLHYAVLDTGGTAPNVVQPHAKVTYLIRAPQNHQVQEIFERINKIAQGAALMTETELTIDFSKACSNIVNNRVLEKQMDANLQAIPTPVYTEEELAYAKKINDTVEVKGDMFSAIAGREYANAVANQEIVSIKLPYMPLKYSAPASSDVGDVSWNAPTAQLFAACYSKFTPEHSWQLVSQGKSSVAHKGLIYAAKVMAATAIDLYEDAELVEAAKKDLQDQLGGMKYVPAIPDEVKPAVPVED